MSRLGKMPITVDDRVEIEMDGPELKIKGPKGELEYTVPEGLTVSHEDKKLCVIGSGEVVSRDLRATHGLCRSLLQGMITGVTKGFRRQLEIQGVGYRGSCSGQNLTLNLGFSHPVEYSVPEGVSISMPNQTTVVLESIDKQKVGQVAATIRGFRPPDAYKGKGIRYAGEQISLKEGKTVA